MNIGFDEQSAYRFERKFLVDGMDLSSLLAIVKMHPAFFRELFPPRFNNNIYYDTPAYDFFWENVDGLANRVKVRIRWYGELWGDIEKPTLEFKVKAGLVGRKPSYKIKPFTIQPTMAGHKLAAFLQDEVVPEGLRVDLKALHPALINRYRRYYYMSADNRYRLTIDVVPEFFKPATIEGEMPKHILLEDRIIMEVKFTQDAEQDFHKISNYFPFRMTKSSKYVDGVDLLGETILS